MSELDEAKDLNTNAARLRVLAGSQDPDVRRAVAQNPVASKEALAAVALEFPDDVFSNPASNLFDLELDGPLMWLGFLTRGTLASAPTSSAFVLDRMATDHVNTIRRFVAVNKAAPVHVLEMLARDPDNDVRAGIAQRTDVSPGTMSVLARDADPSVRWTVAINEKAPSDALEELSYDKNEMVLSELTKNKNAPDPSVQRALLALSQSNDTDKLIDVARHMKAPREALVLLAKNTQKAILGAVAGNANTPAELLRQLASHWSPGIRAGVAANPSADLETLKELASSEETDASVRKKATKQLSARAGRKVR